MQGNFSNIQDLINVVSLGKIFKFKLKVIAGSKIEQIEFLDDFIKLKIKERPIEGRANKAIIDYFSKLLKIPKTKIEILNGQTSSIKTIQINL